MQEAASRANSAPKYSNRVLSTANSSWELHLVLSKIQGGSSSFCWVFVTKIEKDKGSAVVSGAIHVHTGTMGTEENLHWAFTGGEQWGIRRGSTSSQRTNTQIHSFTFSSVTRVLTDQKEGYVMVVWAAPSFSIWFSTKMSPKVNTPTMCVLKDSKKRKK